MADNEARLALVKKYLAHRLAKENDEVVKCVADSIVIESSRDGTFTGKDEVRAYLDKTAPSGTWNEPEVQDDGTVVQTGSVTVMFMSTSVNSTSAPNADANLPA